MKIDISATLLEHEEEKLTKFEEFWQKIYELIDQTTRTLDLFRFARKSNGVGDLEQQSEKALNADVSIKKRLAELVLDYRNSLSMLVGFFAILYLTVIPCSTVKIFRSLLVAGGIGIGLFGLLGFIDLYDVVDEVRKVKALYTCGEVVERRKESGLISSSCSYIWRPIVKIVFLTAIALFFTFSLGFYLHTKDKECEKKTFRMIYDAILKQLSGSLTD